MGGGRKISALVGSYRKGGIIDQAVDEILASASREGAEVQKIYLADSNLAFCTNCRVCTQSPGNGRGLCPIMDDLAALLDQLEKSDAIILASPTNFGTVTAVMKRFVERLVCYAYWPWGNRTPKLRERRAERIAVLVASSAAPAFLARPLTPTVRLLKQAAGLLGASTVGVLFIGLAARERDQQLAAGKRKKARLLGQKLASGPV